MKSFILLISIVFCSLYSFAQLKTIPAKVDTSCSPSVYDFDLEGTITGNTTSVHWTRTIVFMTKGWTNYICTGSNCFPDNISSGDFSLKAGSESQVYVHFVPNNIPGCATVNYTITDNNDPSNTFTSVYNLCTWATATGDVKSSQAVQVYPNPTFDYFSIKNKENISRINVINLLGKTIRSFSANANVYDVSDLVAGVYILQMLDNNGKSIKTSRLSVRKP